MKLNYCSPYIWKKIFLFKKIPIFLKNRHYFFCRSSIIPNIYSNMSVFIYDGKKWHVKYITKWSVGYKLGEFTWNKRCALYKAKQLKKKKKK